jgi:hypothetical protein
MTNIPVWSWRHAIAETDCAPSTKLICYTLSLKLSDAGDYVHISQAELGRQSGLSERSVRDHLEAAALAGLLERELLRNASRQVIGTRYWPRFPEGFELATRAVPRPESGPAKSAGRCSDLPAESAARPAKSAARYKDTFSQPLNKKRRERAAREVPPSSRPALGCEVGKAPKGPCLPRVQPAVSACPPRCSATAELPLVAPSDPATSAEADARPRIGLAMRELVESLRSTAEASSAEPLVRRGRQAVPPAGPVSRTWRSIGTLTQRGRSL